MDMVLKILTSIGVNETFFLQFASFVITFLFLNHVAFKPYLEAYKERKNRTVGDQDKAVSVLKEVESLNSDFQTEARALNDKIKAIFFKQREKTKEEIDSISTLGLTEAEKIRADGTAALNASVDEAKKQLQTSIPDLASLIEGRIAGDVK